MMSAKISDFFHRSIVDFCVASRTLAAEMTIAMPSVRRQSIDVHVIDDDYLDATERIQRSARRWGLRKRLLQLRTLSASLCLTMYLEVRHLYRLLEVPLQLLAYEEQLAPFVGEIIGVDRLMVVVFDCSFVGLVTISVVVDKMSVVAFSSSSIFTSFNQNLIVSSW